MRSQDDIVNFSKTHAIYQSRLELLRAAKTATDLAQLQYINGVIGYLDVLDAQRSYFDAQISFSNANRDACIAFVACRMARMSELRIVILLFDRDSA